MSLPAEIAYEPVPVSHTTVALSHPAASVTTQAELCVVLPAQSTDAMLATLDTLGFVPSHAASHTGAVGHVPSVLQVCFIRWRRG